MSCTTKKILIVKLHSYFVREIYVKISHSTPPNQENPNENEESHTRQFGYPQNPSVTVNFRDSRGLKRLQRFETPPEGARHSKGEFSGFFQRRNEPPEAFNPSGGQRFLVRNLEDVLPSRAQSFLLLSRYSCLRSPWIIRCPPRIRS